MTYHHEDYTQARQAEIATLAAFYLKHVYDGVVPTMTELLVDLPEALATLRSVGVDVKSAAALREAAGLNEPGPSRA